MEGEQLREETVEQLQKPGSFMRRALHLFGRNWICAVLFEAIYKVLISLAIYPLITLFLDITMKTSGIAYIADYNLSRVFTNPLAWVFLIVLLMLLAFYAVFEMCGLVTLYEASREDKSLSIRELTVLSAKDAWRIWKPCNFAMIPFILVLVPLTNAGLTSGFITQVHIPEFIADYISNNAILFTAEVVLAVFLSIFAFLHTFLVHYFTLYDLPFGKAMDSSRELLRKRWLPLLVHLILIALILLLVEFLGNLGLEAIGARTIPLPADPSIGQLAAFFGVYIGQLVFSGVLACFSVPVTYAVISQVFYDLLAKTGGQMPIRLEGRTLTAKQHRRHLVVFWVGLTVLVAAATGVIMIVALAVNDDPSLLKAATEDRPCVLLAHRGVSDAYPENTMPAFVAAIDQKAEWIELDVQQTKDGVLVVSHDSTLKRTTGVNKAFYEMTWDQIKDLDAGSWFSSEFSYVRISKLEDVLELAKDSDIKLNIELKPDGHATDRDDPDNTLEKATVKLVKKYIEMYDMGDRIALASINYDCLKKIKAIDPTITTIYDMTLAYGDVASDPYVDIYSVDEACVTQALVDNVHAAGKVIFAWTVNQPEDMEKMYSYGVDGLVTDKLQEAREVIVENGEDSIVIVSSDQATASSSPVTSSSVSSTKTAA